MSIVINPEPSALPADLVDHVTHVDVPTFGHFLEEGFAVPELRMIAGSGRLCGRAVTVKAAPGDSTLIHLATAMLSPGDVLVIDTGGDRMHAALGGLVGSAVSAAGAVGVLVDGVCTDAEALRDSGLFVYARGTTVLTNKLLGVDSGGINVEVECGGVSVQPGWIVLGDENGVLIADPAEIARVLADAQASDSEEPNTIAQLREGAKLPALTPAGPILTGLGVEWSSR